MPHKCPINGCHELVAGDKLMCATHWKHVPRVMKRMVYGTWFRRVAANHARQELEEHRATCRQAVDTVNGLTASK